MITARLVPEAQDVLTPSEAMAGMILNGLGFANRPWSLTPQFVARTPLAVLCRAGMGAELCNRFPLGRTREEAYTYGGDLLFQELALAVCAHEGIDRRCHPLDATRVSRRGADVPDRDEHAMTITHGDSREHRPDLKQAVLERMVSPDGGDPLLRKRGDGPTSDTQIVQERAQALWTACKNAPSPRYLLADSTRDHDDQAATRANLGFITRLPNTMGSVSQVMRQALPGDTWHLLDAKPRDPRLEWCHDGIAQRWLGVPSQAALARAAATVNHARQRDEAALAQQRVHRQAQRFETPEMAHEARAAGARSWTSHQVESANLIAHQRSARKGRPTPHTPLTAITWHIQAQARPDQEALEHRKPCQACCVLGTNIDASELRDTEVIQASKGQSRVDGGFRVRNDPRFFVSSLLVTKPCRMQGLLMGMTLALLVYSVTQRRLRQPWAAPNATVPHHMTHPTTAPT